MLQRWCILPVGGEEKIADSCSHVCSEESGCVTKTLDCKHEHDENCGYAPAAEGTPCTFVCEICNGTEEEELTESTGETFCTEDSVDSDSSDSSAEEAVLTACKGAAPMLAAAAPLSVEYSGHDGWKELNGGLKGYLDGGNYVLTGDVLLYDDLLGKTNQNVIICLNGHEIDGNSENMQNLTICDCTGNGKIINTNLEAVSLSDIGLQGCEITGSAEIDNSHIESGSISNMTDMTIASGTDILSSEINVNEGSLSLDGANVQSVINVNGGTCNISGATRIRYLEEATPAVNVNSGTCNITGGTISNPIVVAGGTCNITGGTIKATNNALSGETTGAVVVKGGNCNIGGDAQISGCRIDNGGAVSVLGGNCTISGINVYDNNTEYGGVYVVDGTCTIEEDGSVYSNQSFNQGGGVYVAGGECRIATKVIGANKAKGNGGIYVGSEATVKVNNTSSGLPQIKYNEATGNGGGVYLCEGTECDNLCDLMYNKAQYGGDIYSEGDCKLTIWNGSIQGNIAKADGGGLYLNDSHEKPCIVEIKDWTIKENVYNSDQPNNIVSLDSKITYDPASSAQDTLPYDEPGSIMLRNDASFTILDGKHKVDDAISCFDIQDNNKILIAGGFYDKDPAQEPTLTVLDNVKLIKLDGDIGHDQYDPNYPWAVYPVKDGIMSGTSNNPVYDGASIEKDVDFSLSRTADIQKLFYWYKAQGEEDSSYVAGLPSDAGNYTIKAGGLHLRTIGEEYYTECTFDLTIAKADPSYTVPTGIIAQVGKPLSKVTLPEGWAWKDGSTIPQTEGTQTYPAIFAPDDTANYNTVETDISVEVEHAHKGVLVEEVPATCTQTGEKAYYECSICHQYFEDEACNKPIADLDSWKVIPVLGHDFGGWTSNGNGTHTGTCQRDGCDATDTQNCSGREATYFLKAECEICGGAYGELKEDTTLPTGEIRIDENKWNKFLNTITFGLFFKETQSIVITADDDSYSVAGYTDDKAAVIEYYLYDGDTALSQEELKDKEFTTYTGSLNMEPDGKYTIYVRITDHAGNKTYISSDGIVMYTDAKQDTESISFVKTTTEDVTASVFTNGNTVKEIRNGATVLSDSDYSVSYEGNKATITFKAAYLDTLTVGGYTLTLSYITRWVWNIMTETEVKHRAIPPSHLL